MRYPEGMIRPAAAALFGLVVAVSVQAQAPGPGHQGQLGTRGGAGLRFGPPGQARRRTVRRTRISSATNYDHGVLPNGRIVKPAGRSVQVGMNPLGARLTPDGRFLVVSNNDDEAPATASLRNEMNVAGYSLSIVDTRSMKVVSQISTGGRLFVGLQVTGAGPLHRVGVGRRRQQPEAVHHLDGRRRQPGRQRRDQADHARRPGVRLELPARQGPQHAPTPPATGRPCRPASTGRTARPSRSRRDRR